MSFPMPGPKPVTRNVPNGLFWKSRGQVQHLGELLRVCSGLETEILLQVRPRSLSQEMCPRNILEKAGSRSKTWGDLFDFCRVLEGRSFCSSGPETCHKKCAQGTFGKKWGAVPRPGGTYLVFVGSWKGGHFARQARKPVTRNVPKEHFGKSGEPVQHLGGLI